VRQMRAESRRIEGESGLLRSPRPIRAASFGIIAAGMTVHGETSLRGQDEVDRSHWAGHRCLRPRKTDSVLALASEL
jgi:hypothetical protein